MCIRDRYGFEVSTSELGIVIGFSFSGGVIPAGDGLLTNISYTNADSGVTEICISDTIVSDINGNGLLSSGECVDYETNEVPGTEIRQFFLEDPEGVLIELIHFPNTQRI